MSFMRDEAARVALRAARGRWHRVVSVRRAYSRARSPQQTARFTAHCRVAIRSTARRHVGGELKGGSATAAGLGATILGLFVLLPIEAATGSVISLFYVGFVLFAVRLVTFGRSEDRVLGTSVVLVTGAAVVAYLLLGTPPLTWSWWVGAGQDHPAGQVLLTAPLWFVVLYLFAAFWLVLRLVLRRRVPPTDDLLGATVLDLVDVAFALGQPGFATSLARKQQVIQRLERAASGVRARLANAFQVRDPAQGEVIADRFERFARALEAEVRTVANPKPDTETELLDRLLGAIQCLSDGCFDCLPSLDEAPGVRRRRLRTTLGRSLLLAIIGAVPAACVLLAPRVGLPLEGDPAAVLNVGVVVWLIVFLLLAFDRSIDRKVDEVKNVLSVFRGG